MFNYLILLIPFKKIILPISVSSRMNFSKYQNRQKLKNFDASIFMQYWNLQNLKEISSLVLE